MVELAELWRMAADVLRPLVVENHEPGPKISQPNVKGFMMQKTTWRFIKATKSARLAAGLACAVVMTISQAYADVIQYCDVHGTDVDFVDISEVSASPNEMFGQPQANWNSISMPAFGFNAQASGGIDFQQGLMEITITAHEGQLMDSIVLNEFGSFFQFGDDTDVLVHTSAFVEIDGQMYDVDSTFANSGSGAGNWNQSVSLAFPATEELRLVIDTQVFASAEENQVAFVDKIGMSVSVNAFSTVPEPEIVFGLASVVGLGLVFARRRRLQDSQRPVGPEI